MISKEDEKIRNECSELTYLAQLESNMSRQGTKEERDEHLRNAISYDKAATALAKKYIGGDL